MEREESRRAFTLVDLLAILIVVGLVMGALLLPMLGTQRCGSRHLRDSTQIRGVHQGMVLWAQSNQDKYPLPSLVDAGNATIDADTASKDTTANIISLMIFNGFFSPEICVSPAEQNPAIRIYDKYQYTEPTAAADAKKALWDPAFSVDFTKGTGGLSYGHTPPAEERLADWGNTFDPTKPAIGNRGPEIASVAKGKKSEVRPTLRNPASHTLLIHGGRTTWEGNIAYNDNHVNFETSMSPEGMEYRDAAGKAWRDTLFLDEDDDPGKRNGFMGIFVTAGKKKAEFRGIWD